MNNVLTVVAMSPRKIIWNPQYDAVTIWLYAGDGEIAKFM